MQQQSIVTMVLDYFKEMLQRFAMKSPTFFRIIQVVAGLLVLLCGSPWFLAWTGAHVPMIFGFHGNTIVGWIAAGALFVAMMPTQSPSVAVTTRGELLKQTTPDKLPFTTAKEAEAASKNPIPVVEKTDMVTTVEQTMSP